MKRILKMLIIFSIVCFLVIPSSSAWNWPTHKEIADDLYNSTPNHIKKNLDLNEMRKGSILPDIKDKDKSYHGYPKSINEASYYLNLAKSEYNKGDYKKASKYYGMASHYISDTFAAPHCGIVNNRQLYYQQAINLKPVKHSLEYKGLDELLQFGNLKGKNSLNHWEKTKSTHIVQDDLNRAYSATFLAYKTWMGF
jgi:hypothetical protein